MPYSASDYFQQLLPSQAERARKRFFGQLGDVDQVAGQGAPQKRTGPILKLPGKVQPDANGQLPQETQQTQTEQNQPNLRIPQTFPQGKDYTPYLTPGFGGGTIFNQVNKTSLPGTPVGGSQSSQAPLRAHHGFWDRLKSIGEGFLVNAGQYSATHPGASAGEVLAAGGVGGIVGGVKPQKIDQQIFNQKSAREMARRAQEAEIQRVEAEARKAGQPQKPVYETRVDENGNEVRQQWNPQTGQLEDVMGPDGKPVVVKKAGLARPERNVVDGRVVERQPDGSWKEVYAAPAKPEKPVKKGVHVVSGRLVDDEGKVIYEAPEKPARTAGGKGGKLPSGALGVMKEIDEVKVQIGQIDDLIARGQAKTTDKDGNEVDLHQARQILVQKGAEVANRLKALGIEAGPGERGYPYYKVESQGQALNATEQKIYDAAKGKGLDPDEAIRRYRAGKY